MTSQVCVITVRRGCSGSVAVDPPVVGHPCSSDAECWELQLHTVCSDRRLCTCDADHVPTADERCRRRSDLTEPCGQDSDCKVSRYSHFS